MGDIDQRHSSWLRKRGSDFQGRLCSVARSWELATFFLRGCLMKEFLLVMIGFILGSAIGVDGFMEIVNKVIGLFS